MASQKLFTIDFTEEKTQTPTTIVNNEQTPKGQNDAPWINQKNNWNHPPIPIFLGKLCVKFLGESSP